MEHKPKLVEEHKEAWLVVERSGEELLEIDDETGEEIEEGNLVVETSLRTAVVRELGSGWSCEERSCNVLAATTRVRVE